MPHLPFDFRYNYHFSGFRVISVLTDTVTKTMAFTVNVLGMGGKRGK